MRGARLQREKGLISFSGEKAETELKENGRSGSARDHARSRTVLAGDVAGSAQHGRIDLEATETAMRAALQRAGPAALSQLLQFPARAGQRARCGYLAHSDSSASSAIEI